MRRDLTLVALAVLLGGSGCGKATAPPSSGPSELAPPATTDATSANQMSEFEMVGYAADGTKRWELRGEEARVEESLVTIRHPFATGYEPDRTSYLRAATAQINQTNRRMRMEQDVTIHTSDGLWLASPLLYWLPDEERVTTDLAVRLETDHMLLWGRGASAHTQLKQVVIDRDIELVLNPSDGEQQGQGGHVTITCEGPLSFDHERHVATFEGNVHVRDPSGDLYSDKLIAHLDKVTRTITYAEAIGHVRIEQGQNIAMSERALYEPGIGKVTLLGSPRLVVYPEEGKPPVPGTLGTSVEGPSAATYQPPTSPSGLEGP